MSAPKSARDILLTELKEIHSAERQMSRALPKLLRQIQSEELKRMLEQRREQGATIIEELDGISADRRIRGPLSRNAGLYLQVGCADRRNSTS